MDKKCEKVLPGVRGPKTGQTLLDSMTEQIFELQAVVEKTAQRIRNLKDEIDNTPKHPHVRIEFDDIRDVPKVWVDGKLIGDIRSNRPLVSLKIDWNTDTATDKFKGFDVNYLDFDSKQYPMRGYHQGMVR